MPVTIRPSSNKAESWGSGQSINRYPHATSREHLLQVTHSDEGTPGHGPILHPSAAKEIVQSSFDKLARDNSTIFACKNGLVHAALEAYNEHYRLVLRPDDVWIAILTQLSVYVNANAEQLRHLFVAHDGQAHLHIEVELRGLDHGKMAYEMTKLMAAAMKDPTLRDWVLPAFSTTEKTDQTVAAIVFMGTMQKYFTYSWGTRCGLPEVTLLGEADDWAEIRTRCEARLASGGFGPGAQQWWAVLRPVLDGLIASFVDPNGRSTRRFWSGICDVHKPNGSGSTSYSGWITAFCYWDEEGRCLHDTAARGGGFSLLGGKTVQLARGEVPVGFSKVPVTLVEAKKIYPTEMVAGLLAINASKSAKDAASSSSSSSVAATRGAPTKAGRGSGSKGRWDGYDTIQPEAGWFMYFCEAGPGHLKSL